MAVAVAFVKKGKGLIKVNGVPIELVEPKILRSKVWEPILLLGANRYSTVDIRIRVKGGGQVAQIYAIRQAVAKSLVAWYQKMWMRLPSAKSKMFSWSTIVPSLLLTLAVRSPRSSVVVVLVHVSRNPTVEYFSRWLLDSICWILCSALSYNKSVLGDLQKKKKKKKKS